MMQVLLVAAVLCMAGAVLIAAACVALGGARRAEVSARAVGAFALGIAGADALWRGATAADTAPGHVLAVAGVALWLGAAMWARRAAQMRRAGDWWPDVHWHWPPTR